MLSRLVINFLPRSNRLLISWLQSPSAVILEPRKIKSATVSTSICHEVMGPDATILVFWMLSFKATFSLSSFTFIKQLFSSFSLSAIRVVSSASSLLDSSLAAESRGHSLAAVLGPLFVVTSLAVEHGLYGRQTPVVTARRLSSCGSGLQSTGSTVMAHRLSCSLACGIFLDQGSNLCLLHWQAHSLPLSHQGSTSFFLIFKLRFFQDWSHLIYIRGNFSQSCDHKLILKNLVWHFILLIYRERHIY